MPASRLLKLKEAAQYCGLSPRSFRRSIGLPPIRLGPHELWDKLKLDAYIDGLQGKKTKTNDGWASAVSRF